MKKDNLVRMLESRPDYDALLNKGVVKADAEWVASSVQANRDALTKNLMKSIVINR